MTELDKKKKQQLESIADLITRELLDERDVDEIVIRNLTCKEQRYLRKFLSSVDYRVRFYMDMNFETNKRGLVLYEIALKTRIAKRWDPQ